MDIPAGFDPALHAPARLQIAAVLAQASEAEFSLLKDVTGSSDSVMSKHLTALAEAGYVSVRKAASSGRQRTWASLTSTGRKAFKRHVKALEQLVASVASGEGPAGEVRKRA